MNQSRSLTPIIGVVLLMILAVALVWVNYQIAERHISGEGFEIQWIGIHSLVTDANSPYSDQVTRQIQETVDYQNSFTEGENPRYTSPLFSGIVVLPAALIENKIIARAVWLTTQLVDVFIILIFGLKITNWKPAWYLFLLFILITVLSYHVLLPWLDGGLSLWATFFLVLVILSIRNNWNEIGGIFLALVAIQPQMTILVILFTLFWAASQRKRILILWFFMTLILLSILGVFLVPDWILRYIRMVYNFRDTFPPGSLGALFIDLWPGLGKQLGWLVSIILGVILIVESWIALKKDYRHFLWTACLILVITQWIGIPTIPANFIGLLLPIITVAALVSERWPKGGQWIVVLFAFVLFVWEWALLYNDVTGARPGMQLNLLIPLPLLLLIGLYWVKWSAIRPKRMLMEELRSSETY